MDSPFYDPLWQTYSAERYLYATHDFAQRSQFVPEMYKPTDLRGHRLSRKFQKITANIPRIVCDFPFYKEELARKLEFNHQSLLRMHREITKKLQERDQNSTSSL